jgi:hypothetical protein
MDDVFENTKVPSFSSLLSPLITHHASSPHLTITSSHRTV